MSFQKKNNKLLNIELKVSINTEDLLNDSYEKEEVSKIQELNSNNETLSYLHNKKILTKADIKRNIEKYKNNACKAFKNKNINKI